MNKVCLYYPKAANIELFILPHYPIFNVVSIFPTPPVPWLSSNLDQYSVNLLLRW